MNPTPDQTGDDMDKIVVDALMASARAQERAAKAQETLSIEVRTACQEMAATRTLGRDYLARAKDRDTEAATWRTRLWSVVKPGIVGLVVALSGWVTLSLSGAGQGSVASSAGVPTPESDVHGETTATAPTP